MNLAKENENLDSSIHIIRDSKFMLTLMSLLFLTTSGHATRGLM